MGEVDLRYRTGSPAIDALLRALVVALDEALPGRVRSSFLIGSQADGSADAEARLAIAGTLRLLGEADE